MNDSEKMLKNIEEELKKQAKKKNELFKRIDAINVKTALVNAKIEKVDEDLAARKSEKRFLDMLSLEAGLKKLNVPTLLSENSIESSPNAKKLGP